LFFRKKESRNFILPSFEVITDGRILMVMKSGFLQGTIVLPRFLLHHIKQVAASPNTNISIKRGELVIEELMKEDCYDISIEKREPENLDGISRKIVKLAQEKGYKLLTIEDELEPFTRMLSLKVLKIKELGAALKQAFFKGDILRVKPVKRGRYTREGIAYLDDNSTVVIEGASTSLGKIVRCKVISVLDLPTGRVIFAEML